MKKSTPLHSGTSTNYGTPYFSWPAVLLGVLLWCPNLDAGNASTADTRTRNAIFNGNFFEGLTAWGMLGPGSANAELSTDKSQLADILIVDLIVSSPGMQRTFSVYNTYLLQVQQDRKYKMILKASGQGDFSFGAFEYDEKGQHIGNKYSERYELSSELKEFSFVYEPSPNATGIRPSIVFLEATDGEPTDVRARIRSVELPVPVDEFSAMCKTWPDYAKDDRFANYKGFSETELKELQAMTNVDTVLPPYEPIRMQAPGDFKLTTSRVRFDKCIFPESVSILGKEILAGPMELLIELADGTKLNLHPSKPSMRSTDLKAVLEQKFSAAGVGMTATLEMEYDAFLVYTLKFPKKPGMAITKATLSIPFLPETAKYIRYSNARPYESSGFEKWVFGCGSIPAKGEKVETKLVIGSVYQKTARVNDWKPGIPGDDGFIWKWDRGVLHNVWIGNEYRGLSFVSLSQQGYHTREGDATVRLERSGKAVKLTCSFITDKATLDKERKLQFALQFMPPKPVRADWLFTRFNSYPGPGATSYIAALARGDAYARSDLFRRVIQGDDEAVALFEGLMENGKAPHPWAPKSYRKYQDVGFMWNTAWSEGCGTPLVKYPQRFAKMVKYSDRVGYRGLPYLAATHIAAEDPAGYYYAEKTGAWTTLPNMGRGASVRSACPCSMFSAYIARGIGKLIDDYGITGIYFDNCAPILCRNADHGCGFIDEDGKLQPTLPLLGFRKLFMMVRHEFVKRGREPFITTHAGSYPGAVSFTDLNLDGEGYYGSDHTEMFSLGEWRAMCLGANQFGLQFAYLPQFGYGIGPGIVAGQEEIGTPRLLAMSLLHGTPIVAEYIDRPLVDKVWDVLDELDEPDIAFIPYWEWEGLNKPLNSAKVYASAYSGKDRLILVLSNLSGVERNVAVPLSEIRAKNPSAGHVVDNMHALPVSIEDGTVKCTIAPKNFRLLSFTR